MIIWHRWDYPIDSCTIKKISDDYINNIHTDISYISQKFNSHNGMNQVY